MTFRRTIILAWVLIAACTTPNPSVTDQETVNSPGTRPEDYEAKRASHEAWASNLMIATQGEAATAAGLEVARLGGNLFDVAAAVSFAISVERPQSTGIGGGGFMMIHHAATGKTEAVDFREVAPLAATETMFQDPKGEVLVSKSKDGIFAAGVPGTVAGVLAVHTRYGKLSRQKILAPAIRLARDGFPVYEHLAKAMEAKSEVLKAYPYSGQVFLKADGRPYAVGEILKQPDLALTLEAIAARGNRGFYRGSVAAAMVAENNRLGGLLTSQDLETYQVKFRQPVQGSYGPYKIASMPPPSSGGTHVIQILNMLEPKGLRGLGPDNPETVHFIASAMQIAFADRAHYMGDTDFVNVPVKKLTSSQYARERFRKVGPKARSSKIFEAPKGRNIEESDETTHFTIMDQAGNVVSSTQTINGWFGSGVTVPGTGVVLNNQMDDFTAKPGTPNMFGAIGGVPNGIAPKKRPLSSMSPTIVFKEDKPVLALGTPSGTRIISCVTLTMLNYLEFDMPLYEAVSATRFHHQWYPDEIRVGPPYFSDMTAGGLQEKGYKLNKKELGCKVQAVARRQGKLHGVSDPRGAGLARGL